MSIIYILIPVAIILTTLGIYLFFWAVKTEQFEDLEKQGLSILFDEDEAVPNNNAKNQPQDVASPQETKHQTDPLQK